MDSGYIQLIDNLQNNRNNQVWTDFGLTNSYHVQDGLDQGEVHASIMWRIFYDPLLCQIDSLNNIVGYSIELNNSNFLVSKLPTYNKITISNMVFVDDTV